MSQRKHKAKISTNPQGIVKKSIPGSIHRQDAIAAGMIFLYSIIEFIPELEGGDVMGSQWLYINVLNILVTSFILFRKNSFINQNFTTVLKSIPAALYFFVLLLAIVSIAVSINKIEAFVNIARLVNAVIMFINLAFLLYGRLKLLTLLIQLFSIYLLIQSVSTISAFYKGLDERDINTLILGLTGNAGNKNILAASLVIKIPFVIYCIYTFNNWKRFFNVLVLSTGTFAIFLLNSRSSYIGLLLILLVFVATIIFLNYRKGLKQKLLPIILIILPVVFAFFLSVTTIKNAIAMNDEETPYGTVIERLNSIRLTAEGSNSRTQMWGSAIEHIKKNPLIGCGYGNWKLASIPYEKSYADEFLVAYHSHNDFLEITAELGVIGGLAYVLIFIFLVLRLLRTVFASHKDSKIRLIAAIFLMGLTVYFVDAFLNFPLERPVMQFYFALVFAVSLLLTSFNGDQKPPVIIASQKIKLIGGVTSLLLLLPSLYITHSTYKSFQVQKKVNRELKTGNLEMKWDEINKAFPSIPNMNAFCYPNDIIRGIYLVEERQYDKALFFLSKGTNVNPHLPVAEFYKARVFLETNKLDSANIYAHQAFFTRPRSKASYQLLNDINIRRNDTAALTTAFNEYIQYRNEAWAWNHFIDINIYLNQHNEKISQLIDSALKFFPGDQDLIQKKASLLPHNNSSALSPSQEEAYQESFAKGLDMFSKQKYPAAILHFTKASELRPTDYVSVENIGVCYYSSGNFNKAIGYFDRVLQSFNPIDGKSELLKALCLLSLGNKSEGCDYLRKSEAKGHPQAKDQILNNCK